MQCAEEIYLQRNLVEGKHYRWLEEHELERDCRGINEHNALALTDLVCQFTRSSNLKRALIKQGKKFHLNKHHGEQASTIDVFKDYSTHESYNED